MANKNVLLKNAAGDTLYPQIADNSITTKKLTDGSVTKEKLADDINLASVVNTTWYELKQLRDNKKLVPGMQYRITDYKCTTTQEDTQSAGHQFDIVVTADSEDTLNEVARAIKHYGDIYFANCNLAAWKIWYCLDNDTNRFAWADNTASIAKVTSGSNTYYLYEIADPANFQNGSSGHISYTFFKNYDLNDNTLYALVNSKGSQSFSKVDIDSQGYITIKNNLGNYSSGTKEELLAAYPNAVVCEVGHGVIYRMIDEYNNDCPYDFKNIMFNTKKTTDGTKIDTRYYYTFSDAGNPFTVKDTSISGINKNNIIYGIRSKLPFCIIEESNNYISTNSSYIHIIDTGSYTILGNNKYLLISGGYRGTILNINGKSNKWENIQVAPYTIASQTPDGTVQYMDISRDYVTSTDLKNYEKISDLTTKLADYALASSVDALQKKVNNLSIPKLVSTTDSDYAALNTKDSNTLYCIPEE